MRSERASNLLMHRIKRFLSQILPFVVAVDLLPLGSAQAAAIAPPPPNAVVVPEAADPDPNAGLAPVRIAVLDTGIDANHPDLKGKVAGWQSFTGGNPLTDPNGHGTALASIALPREDARPASLLSVQVLGPDGHAQDAAVVAGVRWAADNGASVILMGFSSPEYSPALAGAIAYAWGKGAVLLAAAGNDGSASPRFPAAMEHVIGVAATDGAGHLLALSNTGSATVAALGANVAAAAPGGGYRAFSGTSASAAEGAELAARLVSAGYTREQVANQIVAAGDSIDGQALRRLNPGNALGRLAAPLAIVKPAAQPSAGSPIYEANGTGTTQTFVSCSGGGGSPPTWTCTATVFGLSPFGTPTGTVSFSLGSGNFSANPNPCTLSSGSCSTTVTHNTGGNTTTLTGTYNGDTTYAGSSDTFKLPSSGTPSPPPTSITTSGSGTYGSTATLTATLTGGSSVSGHTITFYVNGSSVGTATTNSSGVASLSGVSLSGYNAGTNSNYIFATFAGDATGQGSGARGDLVVNKRTLNVTATASNKTYDGTTAASGITFSDDRVAGDTLTVSYTSATFANKNVGAGKTVTVSGLSISGASSGNYTLASTSVTTSANITARTLTVTATGVNKVYDGSTSATAILSDNRIAGDTLTFSFVASFATKTVGTGKTVTVSSITITGGADSGNYTLASTSTTTTANITSRTLTVSASASNKTYDGTTAATVSLSDDRVAGDTLTVSYTSATFASKTVGTGKTVTVSGISISGADSGNYTLASGTATTTANITARTLTITVSASNKVYDGNTTATVSLSDDRVAGDTLTVSYTSATFSSKTVGAGKTVTVSGISISGADSGNYSVSGTATGTADITAKTLTVSGVTASNKVYDGTTAATLNTGGASLVGVVAGDTVTLSTAGASGTFSSKTVGTGKTVTVAGLTIGGADAGNYSLTQPTTTADITAKTLTVSGVTASNKVYDGTTAATLNTGGASLVGVVAGDTVTLSTAGASGAFSSKTVGTGKTVTVAGLTIGGADAGNYSLTQPTTTADITAKTLTVSGVTASNKVYDGTTAATLNTGGASLVGVVAGDTVTLSTAGASGTFSSKTVGTGKTVTVAGLTIGGADAGNYSLTQPTTTADITAKTLTVSGVTASNKVYDGTTAATLNTGGASLVGVVAGDTVTLSTAGASGAFSSKTVGTGKTVTVAGLTIGGADAGNYSLTQPTTTADITAKTLTVSVSA